MQELAPGAAVGRYVVLRTLGAGGMGAVYAAYDPELDRQVALKLLLPSLAADPADVRARIQREARVMARLSHPNVLPVFDVGLEGEQLFVAMELVVGGTLRQWLAERPRGWREVQGVFVAAGRGLEAAHAAGIVHRDFKPDNVLVGKDGRVRVTDFGLARLDRAPDAAALPTPVATPLHLTREGAIVGSPAYMAPEQMRGEAPDARADVFSFCVSLYEALFGERPFAGRTLYTLQQAVLSGKVSEPPPRHRRVPAWLRREVRRGLHKDPAQRPAGMRELLGALTRDPLAVWRRAAVVLVIGGLVAAGVVSLTAAARREALLCSGGEAQLAAVWNPARREAAQRAFAATGLSYAAGAFAATASQLDQDGRGFAALHREACEATHQRREQSEELLDLRMGCLREHLSEVDALVHALETADAAVVQNATMATRGLTPLAACSDTAHLRARVRPPGDAAARGRIERARAVVDEARTLLRTGRFPQAAARARRRCSWPTRSRSSR